MSSENSVPFIAHDAFAQGAARGRFRIVVDPVLAKPYVVRRTRVDLVATALILVGAALALAGQSVAGGVLVVLGIAANRLVRHHAGKIVLHLAIGDPVVYGEVTRNGVMEVTTA